MPCHDCSDATLRFDLASAFAAGTPPKVVLKKIGTRRRPAPRLFSITTREILSCSARSASRSVSTGSSSTGALTSAESFYFFFWACRRRTPRVRVDMKAPSRCHPSESISPFFSFSIFFPNRSRPRHSTEKLPKKRNCAPAASRRPKQPTTRRRCSNAATA